MYADDGFLFFDEDSGNVGFCGNEIDIVSENLNNLYLVNNFDEDERDAIILVRLLAWHSKFKKTKALKTKDK